MTRPRRGPTRPSAALDDPAAAPAPDDTDADFDPYDLGAGTSEHYVDGELYDFEYRRRRADVNHYRRLVAELAPGGPVLELGCGTGRVSLALARDGHQVVGLDLSAPMLARGAARIAALPRVARARVQLVRADMRRFAFTRRFPLVICPFNAFQHLYARRDVEDALACIRAAVADGGRFALDVLHPDLRWLLRDPTKRWARTRFRSPRTGQRVEYTTNQTYDPLTQIAHIRIYYEPLPEAGAEAGDEAGAAPDPGRRTHVVRLAQRQFFPAELGAILAHAGFKLVERWGDFDGEPFEAGSPSQVLVCRLA